MFMGRDPRKTQNGEILRWIKIRTSVDPLIWWRYWNWKARKTNGKNTGERRSSFCNDWDYGKSSLYIKVYIFNNGFSEHHKNGSDSGNFRLKIFIPACVDVERRLFVATWVISANMNKEISRSLVEFHFEPFQMSLMVVSISKIFKVKDTFQTTIFIRVKQKVLFIQGSLTASTFRAFLECCSGMVLDSLIPSWTLSIVVFIF